MQLVRLTLFILSTLCLYVSYSFAVEHPMEKEKSVVETTIATSEVVTLAPAPTSLAVIDIDLNASNDGWDDEDLSSKTGSSKQVSGHQYPEDEQYPDVKEDSKSELAEAGTAVSHNKEIAGHSEFDDTSSKNKLPGDDINFRLKLHSSTHHIIEGRARADTGKILFKSRLMPSNEVKLSLKLKQRELDDVELLAYFDLANFTMELDGANSVLNKNHKQMLNLASVSLRPRLEKQYEGLDYPEHALMLVQMLGYWSVSPEGFVHEKRSIVSQ